MNKKLLLSILLVIFVMQGYSRDIYMYNGTNVVQTIPNIRKITFSDKTMCDPAARMILAEPAGLSQILQIHVFERDCEKRPQRRAK